MSATKSYDYIIVGAGPAGSVVANSLASSSSTTTVLVVEAGPSHLQNEKTKDELAWFRCIDDVDTHWGTRSAPEPQLFDRRIPLQAGKMTGGCGSHNALQYVRGSCFDFDNWEQLGATGWNWNSMLPHFQAIETYDNYKQGQDPTRGTTGPMHVRKTDPVPPAATLFMNNCGYQQQPDYNDGTNQQGVSVIQVNATDNDIAVRNNPYDAFVNNFVKAGLFPNVSVVTQFQVTRVVFDPNSQPPRAIGVEVMDGLGTLTIVKAKKDVILTGGSYNTPKVLLLSGIGDKTALNTMGIPLVKDLPGVGQNLQDHLFGFYQFVANDEKYPDNVSSSQPPSKDWAQVHLFGCLDKTVNAHQPDYQIYFLAESHAGLSHTVDPNHAMTAIDSGIDTSKLWGFLYVFLHPESRGSVTLQSTDPRVLPLIQMNVLSTDRDNQVINDIFGVVQQLQKNFDSQFVKPSTPLIAPGATINTKAGPVTLKSDAASFIRQTVISMWHPVSTARMGTDDQAVVDPLTMKVRGVEGLRVADASVMPTVTSGNTHSPTMAVAHRAASLIVQHP